MIPGAGHACYIEQPAAFDAIMLEFIERLRELSGGKPVGFKLCVGQPWEFMAMVKAMLKTGIEHREQVRVSSPTPSLKHDEKEGCYGLILPIVYAW